MTENANKDTGPESFERLAAQRSASVVWQYVDFLVHNKKWWLTPIIVMLLLFGGLVFFAGTGAAPFIYTLF